jgi:hypothetical protein
MRYGTLTAMYSTGYESFSDVELDNGRHFFNLAYNQRQGRYNQLRTNLRYSLTEDQGSRKSLAENQLFLSPRASREYGDLGVDWGRKLGAFYNLRLLARFSTWRYDNFVEPPESGDPEEEPVPVPRGFRDRDAYRAGLGLSRAFSRSFRFGFAYGFSHFELSNYGEQDVHSLSLTLGYRVAKVMNFGLAVGGYNRTSTNVLEEERSKSGFQVALSLGRAWRVGGLILGLRVGHVPNVGGGAQVGTATVSRVGLYLRPGTSRGRRHWSWDLSGGWARRDPVNNIQSTIENYQFGGGIFYNLGRMAGITLNAYWVDQDAQTQVNAGQFFRVNLGLSLRPLGMTRLANP